MKLKLCITLILLLVISIIDISAAAKQDDEESSEPAELPSSADEDNEPGNESGNDEIANNGVDDSNEDEGEDDDVWDDYVETDLDKEWNKYLADNKFDFESDDELVSIRREEFKEIHEIIQEQNKNKTSLYRLVHNNFSHMTDNEKKMHLGLVLPRPVDPSYVESSNSLEARALSAVDKSKLPLNVDHRKNKCMQPVKYQGSCGSCWAFAATATLEFDSCIKTGKPVSLSEQQIVDCIGKDGCDGGWPANAWLHAATVGGQDSSSYYPYLGNSEKNWTSVAKDCKYDPAQVAATVSTSQPYVYLEPNDIPARMAALAEKKLVVVTYDVPDKFFYIGDGIFDGPCNKTPNHAVVLVGYGTTKKRKIDYWIIRNSWGSSWGPDKNGYALIQRGVNLCGIEENAWVMTSTTGDVPAGKSYDFTWTTSPNGLFTYSNCSYSGNDIAVVVSFADDCGSQCAATPNCDVFSWWGGNCRLKSNSTEQVIALASSPKDGRCGQVIQQPAPFDFKSGSNGLAMVAPKCRYTAVNRKNLQWQNLDEEDCGAVCALNATCAYFDYFNFQCNMYSVANQSIALTPSPYPSTLHKSCGYVTNRDSPVPSWQSSPDGKTMSAPNCGYIGTDSADIGVQNNASYYVRMDSEADCPSRCASTPKCTHFKWSKNYCYLMPLVKPVVYYSATGSCGYVITGENSPENNAIESAKKSARSILFNS